MAEVGENFNSLVDELVNVSAVLGMQFFFKYSNF